MSVKDYTKPRQTAQRLIANFGMAGTIRRTITTGGDPWTPGSGTTTVTNAACRVVTDSYKVHERDGTLIQTGDRKLLVSTEGIVLPAYPDQPKTANVPDVADTIIVNDEAMAIVNVEPLVPGDTVLMWTIQARA